MTWSQLVPRISYLLNFESPPDILVIHCGGNDIGAIELLDFRRQIRASLFDIMTMLPSTKLVWSQILPRSSWRYSKNIEAMNRSAARLNNFAAWICIQSGGSYVKYPEILWNMPGLFSEDGVHLSNIGNEVFLYRLQTAIYSML